jgi:transposase-like protein
MEESMETICNVCHKKAEISKPEKRRDGDLEIHYIACPHCHQEYVIAVTDPALRKNIKKYLRLRQVIKAGKPRISAYREADQLHSANVERSRQLIEGYLGL